MIKISIYNIVMVAETIIIVIIVCSSVIALGGYMIKALVVSKCLECNVCWGFIKTKRKVDVEQKTMEDIKVPNISNLTN